MKTRYLSVMAIVLLLGAAPKENATTKGGEQLQGRWVCVRLEADGKRMTPVEVALMAPRIKIRGSEVEFDTGEKQLFTLEPSASPKEIDIRVKEPAEKGVVPVQRGIYSLEGDTLKVCFGLCQAMVSARDGQITDFTSERPTDFTAEAGSTRVLAIFKRQKPYWGVEYILSVIPLAAAPR